MDLASLGGQQPAILALDNLGRWELAGVCVRKSLESSEIFVIQATRDRHEVKRPGYSYRHGHRQTRKSHRIWQPHHRLRRDAGRVRAARAAQQSTFTHIMTHVVAGTGGPRE